MLAQGAGLQTVMELGTLNATWKFWTLGNGGSC